MLGFLFLTLVAVGSAQNARDGPCPVLKPVENFNLKAYQGTWYEISRFFTESEKDGSCAKAEYLQNGDRVTVKNTYVVNGVQTYVEGTVELSADAKNSGIIDIFLKFGDFSLGITKYIIATDYSNYGLSYICTYDAKTNTHKDYLWVLSRTTQLQGKPAAEVEAYLKAHSEEIDASRLIQGDFSEKACNFTSTKLITTPTKH